MKKPSEKDIYESLLAKQPSYRVQLAEDENSIILMPPEHYSSNTSVIEFFYDEKDDEYASFWLAGMRYSTLAVFTFTTADDIANHYISLVENWELSFKPENSSESV